MGRDPGVPPDHGFRGCSIRGADGVLLRGLCLAAAHEKTFGSALQSFTTPGYLDGRVFALYAGIPALVYGPVSESIHGFDERVHLESVRKVTKTIALFIADWCGVTEPA